MLDKPTTAPDLVGALKPVAVPRGVRLEAPELVDAIGAIADREDVAGIDERARLQRIRSVLELELAARLEE